MKVPKRVLSAVSFAFLLSLTSFVSSNAEVSKNVRISGSDRIETAIKIADEFGKTENVIIATAENYADALVASPLARELNAPILLNRGKSLDSRVFEKIKELGTKNITIVGGNNAVSPDIENSLKSAGMNVSRISGSDRYSTSAQIAEKYSSSVNAKKVVVASGENFPDALVAGPYASKIKAPILLSRKGSVSESVKNIYSRINPDKTIAVGGASSLNPSNINITERISGSNRYNTALEVAKFMNPDKVYIASGEVFADSLVAAPLAARTQSPILLRSRYTVQDNVKNYISSGAHELFTVGGKSTIEMGIENVAPEKDKNQQTVLPNTQSNQQENNAKKKLTEKEKAEKIRAVKREFDILINDYRKSKGMNTLSWFEPGEKGSDIRAKELVEKFSHTRPDGDSYSEAFRYLPKKELIGENIAISIADLEKDTAKSIAEGVFNIWKGSPSHNANMLNGRYDRHVLGVYFSNGEAYFASNLINKDKGFNLQYDFERPENRKEMDEAKFKKMIPDIVSDYNTLVNNYRKEKGLEPLEVADVYSDVWGNYVEGFSNNPSNYFIFPNREVRDGYILASTYAKNDRIYDGDNVDSMYFAKNMFDRVKSQSEKSLNRQDIKAHYMAVTIKNNQIYYVDVFYTK